MSLAILSAYTVLEKLNEVNTVY